MKWDYVTLADHLPLHLEPLGRFDIGELPPGSPVAVSEVHGEMVTLQYRSGPDSAPMGLLGTISHDEALALGRLGSPTPSWVAYRVDGGQEHGLLLHVFRLFHLERPADEAGFTIALEARPAQEINRLARDANQSVRDWFDEMFRLPGYDGPLYLYQAKPPGAPRNAALIGRTHRLTLQQAELDGRQVLIGTDLRPLRNAAEALSLPCALQGEVHITTKSLLRINADASVTTPDAEHQEGSGYFQLWRRYVQLERALLPDGMPVIAYDGVDLGEDADTVEVQLLQPVPSEWPLEESPALVSMTEPPEEQQRSNGGRRIGRAGKVVDGRLLINRNREQDELPYAKGFLAISYAADHARIKRREDALNRIFSGDLEVVRKGAGGVLHRVQAVQMRELGLYLDQPGTCNKAYKLVRPAVTKQLKNSMGRGLTPDQERAVAVALNTPDFALVMGPPGTGKTTVIRAIVERLKEEGEDGILLSAAQHVAVDNMAGRIAWQQVPVLRLGGVQGEEGRDRSVDRLLRTLRTALDAKLAALDASSPHLLAQRTEDELIWFARAPVNLAEQADRLGALLKLLREHLPPALFQQGEYLHMQLQQAANRPVRPERPAPRESGPDAVRSLLRFRPVSAAAYQDGGSLWLARLRQALGSAIGASRTQAVKDAHLAMVQLNRLASQLSDPDQPSGAEQVTAALEAVEIAVEALLPPVVTDRDMILMGATQPNLTVLAWLRSALNHANQVLAQHPDQRYAVAQRFVERLESDSQARYDFLRRHSPASAVSLQQAARPVYGFEEKPVKYLIIDEAARANPLDLMIPFCLAERIIMVGDPQQLPQMLEPIVDAQLSTEELQEHEARALRESLFQRLFEGLPASRTAMLTTQFRMTPVLGSLVSELFYERQVQNGAGLPEPDYEVYQNAPLVWVRSRGANLESKVAGSWRNQREAARLAEQVERLLISRPDMEALDGEEPKIGVITFYRAQVRAIEDALGPLKRHCAVGTVDAFQGREFDLVFLSVVRANARGQLGHVAFKNRLCVALSRARKCLVVVGDDQTASTSPALKRVLEVAKGGPGRVVDL